MIIKLNTLVEGLCVECRTPTEAVMIYYGEAKFLCVECQERIRSCQSA